MISYPDMEKLEILRNRAKDCIRQSELGGMTWGEVGRKLCLAINSLERALYEIIKTRMD